MAGSKIFKSPFIRVPFTPQVEDKCIYSLSETLYSLATQSKFAKNS